MGTEVLKDHVKGLYHVLSEHLGQTLEAFYFNDFELRSRNVYYRKDDRPLTATWGS